MVRSNNISTVSVAFWCLIVKIRSKEKTELRTPWIINETDWYKSETEWRENLVEISFASSVIPLLWLKCQSKAVQIYEKVRKHKICTYFCEIKFKMARECKIIEGCISHTQGRFPSSIQVEDSQIEINRNSKSRLLVLSLTFDPSSL